jgi:hypothetical protein
MAALTLIKDWIKASKCDEDIRYFFSAGSPGQREANNFCKLIYDNDELRTRFRMSGWGFCLASAGTGEGVLPLR